jgi:hypothetical protein
MIIHSRVLALKGLTQRAQRFWKTVGDNKKGLLRRQDMHDKKITWEEMKKKYPNEWLLIIKCDSDESGHLISGIVARHSPEKDKVFCLPGLDQSSAFKYTGKSTFPGGWRARA